MTDFLTPPDALSHHRWHWLLDPQGVPVPAGWEREGRGRWAVADGCVFPPSFAWMRGYRYWKRCNPALGGDTRDIGLLLDANDSDVTLPVAKVLCRCEGGPDKHNSCGDIGMPGCLEKAIRVVQLLEKMKDWTIEDRLAFVAGVGS